MSASGPSGPLVLTCDPSIYTMDHLELTVSNFMGNSIDKQRVKNDEPADARTNKVACARSQDSD